MLIDHAPINLMTVPAYLELAETIGRLADDDDVRVVVFRSANPEWFIAHFDVAAILGFPTASGPMPTELNPFHLMCEQLRTMPKATIAVIDGRVGGGGARVRVRRTHEIRWRPIGRRTKTAEQMPKMLEAACDRHRRHVTPRTRERPRASWRGPIVCFEQKTPQRPQPFRHGAACGSKNTVRP